MTQSSPASGLSGLLRSARNDAERTAENLAPSLRGALATKQSSSSSWLLDGFVSSGAHWRGPLARVTPSGQRRSAGLRAAIRIQW